MKKLLLAVIASFAMLSCAFAQSPGIKLSIGPEVGLPLGDIHNYYGFTLGGTVKLEVPVTDSHLNFTVTTGYINFFSKDYSVSYASPTYSYSYTVRADNVGYIPVKVGGKYYANNIFYVEGEVGIAANTSSGGSTAFAYAPGLGVSLPITNSKNAIDLGARYEGWTESGSTVSQIALRIAYKFGF